jgi:hypothetical protein
MSKGVLVRKVPTQSEVDELVSLFSGIEALDEELEPGLRSVLRVSLQFRAELQRLGNDPVRAVEADASLHSDIDMLRDDIRSVLDSYAQIESVAVNLSGIPRVPWPVLEDPTWADAIDGCEKRLARLREPGLELSERLSQLVGLIRIQLSFWGRTAGMTSSGFIS